MSDHHQDTVTELHKSAINRRFVMCGAEIVRPEFGSPKDVFVG